MDSDLIKTAVTITAHFGMLLFDALTAGDKTAVERLTAVMPSSDRITAETKAEIQKALLEAHALIAARK